MPPVKIHLRANQYVDAVQGVRRAVRLWRRLDAALVLARKRKGPGVDEAWEALRLLDIALYRAQTALLGSPGRKRVLETEDMDEEKEEEELEQ